MSMRISLDRRYKCAVAVRAESIDIVSIVGGEAGTGLRTDMISNTEAGEFDAQYPTGEPSEYSNIFLISYSWAAEIVLK
eukprot:IDg23386t1